MGTYEMERMPAAIEVIDRQLHPHRLGARPPDKLVLVPALSLCGNQR
jgi:hypothetical protein